MRQTWRSRTAAAPPHHRLIELVRSVRRDGPEGYDGYLGSKLTMQPKTNRAWFEAIWGLHTKWLQTEGRSGELADLRGADLHDYPLAGVDLSRANLVGADLTRANLRRACLSRADLRGAQLVGADLRDADLSLANLRGANLSEADLELADLAWADLNGANLGSAVLSEAVMYKADLRGVHLRGADLSGVILEAADLRGADFAGTNLDEVNLEGAILGVEPIAALAEIRAVSDRMKNDLERMESQVNLDADTIRAGFRTIVAALMENGLCRDVEYDEAGNPIRLEMLQAAQSSSES